MCGLKWQAMIQGLAFMSHQLGSFLGAYGGGLIYDALGSYSLAWRIGAGAGGGNDPGGVWPALSDAAAAAAGSVRRKRGPKGPVKFVAFRNLT